MTRTVLVNGIACGCAVGIVTVCIVRLLSYVLAVFQDEGGIAVTVKQHFADCPFELFGRK
jgi:hypothetical protein